MAENSPFNDSYLFLEDGITIPKLPFLVMFVYTGASTILPLLIVGFLFCCCKNFIYYHVDRCPHCIDLTSARAKCKNSTTGKMMKFCNVIERWTAWLLVDLFHTPKVKKVLIKGKLCLMVANRPVQNNSRLEIPEIFFCISTLFCLYIAKVILDIFVKITPTCINEGDFGFPAFCYADMSGIDYQVNCTTWNKNSESLEEITGSLLCVSLFYNFMTTLAELVGLYGLQEITVQIMLSILEEMFTCKMLCSIIFLISSVVFFLLVSGIPTLLTAADVVNSILQYKILHQQFPTTSILGLSIALSYVLFWSTYDITLHNKSRDIIPMLNTTHDCQCAYITKKKLEKQSDGETDILIPEESRGTQDCSIDERSLEGTQSEEFTIAEIQQH